MSALTLEQFAQVADSITNLAAAIDSYLNINDVPDPAYTNLNKLQTTLTNLGSTWEQQAARTAYDDATAAFVKLSSATAAINSVTKQLSQQVANIGKIAAIVGSVADFAVALSAGAPGSILAAASRVTSSIRA
jgi:hypothetical protein